MNRQLKQPPLKLAQRIIRFNELVPCKTAFIDARTPGSDKKENFCLIGAGVAENPGQFIHINIPHGFDIGGARQPHGCKNSHHSHDTEEVFMIFSGAWKFTWGQNGEDGETVLSGGDVISIPTQVFRGFENVGPDDGFMFSILGLAEDGGAGRVIWAPYVFAQAKAHGLILLEDGRLIDTVAGEKVPAGAAEYRPISRDEAAAFQRLSLADMENCIVRKNEIGKLATGGLSHLDDVVECAVIGCANPAEQIGAGKMAWQHGFQVRHLTIAPGTAIPTHRRAEEEVIIVQSGGLAVEALDAQAELSAGDVFTAPPGENRRYENSTDKILEVLVVRRGNHPAAAQGLL